MVLSFVSLQLPVITDLRNPSLKQRHWNLIEDIISHKFDPEVPITLQQLTELKVFDFAEAIQEVSGQASSEASLEAILKKVGLALCIIHVQCTTTRLPLQFIYMV